MQVKKQDLKPDMEQQTSSKRGNLNIKAVYCHPAYLTYMQSIVLASAAHILTYMQSISCEIWGWMNHELESRLLGEKSTT